MEKEILAQSREIYRIAPAMVGCMLHLSCIVVSACSRGVAAVDGSTPEILAAISKACLERLHPQMALERAR